MELHEIQQAKKYLNEGAVWDDLISSLAISCAERAKPNILSIDVKSLYMDSASSQQDAMFMGI